MEDTQHLGFNLRIRVKVVVYPPHNGRPKFKRHKRGLRKFRGRV